MKKQSYFAIAICLDFVKLYLN